MNIKLRPLLLAALLPALALANSPGQAAVNVITTDTNLANITSYVGGSRVRVESLSRGVDDPHAVEPRPSMVLKLSRAQLFVRVGMDLDIWVNGVLDKVSNAGVRPGGRGYVDASRGIRVQEIPPAKLDPSMGDIHVYGNPHYLLDPANAITAASNIAGGLARVDPAGRAMYTQNLTNFANQIKSHLARWRAELGGTRGAQITTYHRMWVYFMKRFGLVEYGTMEPKPGIPPSPGHVNSLIKGMKEDKVKAMLIEDFRSHRYPDLVASRTGAKAVYVPVAVGGEPGVTNYFLLFDTIVSRLAAALK
jgi:ABC-type Zn uptake system ZnuABC Zn-binding protein ZnuA